MDNEMGFWNLATMSFSGVFFPILAWLIIGPGTFFGMFLMYGILAEMATVKIIRDNSNPKAQSGGNDHG